MATIIEFPKREFEITSYKNRLLNLKHQQRYPTQGNPYYLLLTRMMGRWIGHLTNELEQMDRPFIDCLIYPRISYVGTKKRMPVMMFEGRIGNHTRTFCQVVLSQISKAQKTALLEQPSYLTYPPKTSQGVIDRQRLTPFRCFDIMCRCLSELHDLNDYDCRYDSGRGLMERRFHEIVIDPVDQGTLYIQTILDKTAAFDLLGQLKHTK